QAAAPNRIGTAATAAATRARESRRGVRLSRVGRATAALGVAGCMCAHSLCPSGLLPEGPRRTRPYGRGRGRVARVRRQMRTRARRVAYDQFGLERYLGGGTPVVAGDGGAAPATRAAGRRAVVGEQHVDRRPAGGRGGGGHRGQPGPGAATQRDVVDA